jgi:DNA-binding NarL/FixJ family response regulator
MQAGAGDVAPIRVFLCDDVRELRELTRLVLSEDPRIAVVGEAEDGEAGVDGIAWTHPDAVVLDLAMPRLDGLEVIPRMKELAPDMRIVVFTGFAGAHIEDEVLRVGADAYVSKGCSLEQLRDRVIALCRGADEHGGGPAPGRFGSSPKDPDPGRRSSS